MTDKTPLKNRIQHAWHMFLTVMLDLPYVYSDQDIVLISATRSEIMDFQQAITETANDDINQHNILTEVEKILKK